MTEADIGLLVTIGGSVAAGTWQTLRSGVGFLSPFLERMTTAVEETAKGTSLHTVILTDLQATRKEQGDTLHRLEYNHTSAKETAFANHARIEGYAREAATSAKHTEVLCEQILAAVVKEDAA